MPVKKKSAKNGGKISKVSNEHRGKNPSPVFSAQAKGPHEKNKMRGKCIGKIQERRSIKNNMSYNR